MKRLLSFAAKAALLPGLGLAAVVGSSAPAQAAGACSGYVFLQDLITTGGGVCRQQGAAGPVEFTYLSHSGFNASVFTFNTSGTGLNSATFGLGTNTVPFPTNPDPNIPYTFNYTLTHNTKLFSAISNTMSSSINQNQNAGSYKVESTGSGASLTSTLNQAVINNGSYTYSPASLLTDTFNTTLTVTQGDVEFFSATYAFVNPPPPPATTPGPLPLLGAGAAFGFSRKIRSTIKANAA